MENFGTTFIYKFFLVFVSMKITCDGIAYVQLGACMDVCGHIANLSIHRSLTLMVEGRVRQES